MSIPLDKSDPRWFYADGITKITDPFWRAVCGCGYDFLSVTCVIRCPKCGSTDVVKTLDGRSYEEIVAERGEPRIKKI